MPDPRGRKGSDPLCAFTPSHDFLNLKRAFGVDEIVEDAGLRWLEKKGGISLVDMASFDESHSQPEDFTRSPRSTAFFRLKLALPLAFFLLPFSILLSQDVPIRVEERIILVDTYVNGKGPKTFIVDTGATETIIIPSLAQELGIPSTFAGGGQRRGQLSSISVGKSELRNLPIYIFDPPQAIPLRLNSGIHYHGILGYTFLSQFITTINYQGQTIHLSPITTVTPKETEPNTHVISFSMRGGHILVPGKLNGQSGAGFLIDTGASTTLLPRRSAAILKLKGKPMEHPPEALLTTLDSLVMGSMTLTNLPMVIHDPPHIVDMGINYDLLMGHDILSQYRLTFDYHRKNITFQSLPSTPSSLPREKPSPETQSIQSREGFY